MNKVEAFQKQLSEADKSGLVRRYYNKEIEYDDLPDKGGWFFDGNKSRFALLNRCWDYKVGYRICRWITQGNRNVFMEYECFEINGNDYLFKQVGEKKL